MSDRARPAPRPSRRTFLKGVAIGSGMVLIRDLGVQGAVTPALAQGTGGFAMSGLDGGGGVNCLAISADPERLIAGGDISGPKVSTDGGASWLPGMGGFPANGPSFVVCAVAWDPAIAGRAWLATPHHSSADGGLFVSNDGGTDWSLVSSIPSFDSDPDDQGRPRIVGRLIAIGPQGTAVYLAAVDGTIWRYDGFGNDGAGGAVTAVANLAHERGTSISLDPTDPTRAFVSTRTRCWVVAGIDVAGTWGGVATPFSGANAPRRAEEIAVAAVGGVPVVFAACAGDGIRRAVATAGDGAAWDVITPPGSSTKTLWCAVDAVVDGGFAVVAAGCAKAAANASGGFDPITGAAYQSVFIAGDGAAPSPTWSPVCSGTPGQGVLSNHEGGPGGPAWWGYLAPDHGGSSDNRLGAAGFVPEQLVFAPTDPSRLFAVGTQGAFCFDRAAATWYPAMAGLGVTSNNTLHCDPANAGRVAVTNNDHVCFLSTDGMVSAYKNENATGAFPNDGFAAAFDTGGVPSRLYLAVGATSNHQGGVYYLADPAKPSAWLSLGRPAGSDQRPVGLAVRRIANQVVVLAAVESEGIYRRTFSTADPPKPLTPWKRVNTAAMKAAQKVPFAPVRWQHDRVAYLFDHASGVWRSTDGGTTWQRIWSVKDNAAFEGFIAADPDDATGGTVLVAMGRTGQQPGLWRLTGCQVKGATVENGGVHLAAVTMPGGAAFVAPGPVVARPGARLWVVETAQPDLYASSNAGATWTAIGGDVFRRGARRVSDMDVGADGTVYVALRGPGVMRSV